MKNAKLAEKLRQSMGYIEETDIEPMMEELGQEFEVVVKANTGERYFSTLLYLTLMDDEERLEINSVFLAAGDYDELFGKPILSMTGLQGNERLVSRV